MQRELLGAMFKKENSFLHKRRIIKLQIGTIVYFDIGQKFGTAIFDYEFIILFCSHKRKYKM